MTNYKMMILFPDDSKHIFKISVLQIRVTYETIDSPIAK